MYILLAGLFLAVLFVFAFVHESIDLARVLHLDLDEPAFVFCGRVDEFGIDLESLVDFDDCSGYRSVNIRGGLDRFHTSEGVTRVKFVSNRGQFYKDNVTKSSLGEIGNPTRCDIPLDLGKFVG